MIVIDASAMVALVLNIHPHAYAVRRRIADGAEEMHAPHLLDLEVAHTLRRLVSKGDVSAEHGEAALGDVTALVIERHPHAGFLPRIWQLRHNLSAYDAAYIALCEDLDAPLLTIDHRLERAPGHRARIEVV